jgi:hypothetical protein
MKFLRFLLPFITIVAVIAAVVVVLGRSHNGSSPVPGPTTSPTSPSQIWELTEQQTGQIVWVTIKPFTYSGDFIETSDSPGWWIYGTQGEKLFKLAVNGNIVRDNPNDRWDFVNFGGAGGGYQALGTGQGSMVGHYPDANDASGTAEFTIQSGFGQDHQDITWTARRIK